MIIETIGSRIASSEVCCDSTVSNNNVEVRKEEEYRRVVPQEPKRTIFTRS